MASQTLTSVADVWPAGTSVGAYKRSDWPQASLPPSGAPPGSAAATATVASDGSLAFSGLADSTTYFAGAQAAGVWRYRGFSTPQLSAGSSSGSAGKAWAASTAYKAGDVVSQGGALYAANADFTSGASFNAANWTQIASAPADTTAAQTAAQAYADSLNLPRPIARPKVTVVDNGTASWSVFGTGATLNASFTDTCPLAATCQRVTTNGAAATATLQRTLSSTIDLTGKHLVVWIRVVDMTKCKQIDVYAGDSTNAWSYNFTQTVFPNGSAVGFMHSNEWVPLTIPWSPTTTTGTVNRAAAQRFKVSVTDMGTGACVFDVGGFGTIAEQSIWPNGVISLTFDDDSAGLTSIVQPKLGQYGYPATLFPIGENIGAVSHSTVANYRLFVDSLGWDVAAHASLNADHVDLTTLSQAARQANLGRTKAWHVSNAFQTEIFAWPLGAADVQSELDAKRLFSVGRGTGTAIESLPPAKPGWLRGIQSFQPAAGVLTGWVDKIKASKGWGVFVFHTVSASGTTNSQDTATAQFNAFVDYINTQGVDVATIRDVLRKL